VLEGELVGEARPFEIRPVEHEDAWRRFEALHALDWKETRERLGQQELPEAGVAMARSRRLKCPPSRYYLGYVDGAPRGYFSTLPGLQGMAQVEDLFVDPAFRHRGLATALIHHCVRKCREQGARSVVIVADPDDTPKHMYAAMGFRPVAVYSHYLKRLDRPPDQRFPETHRIRRNLTHKDALATLRPHVSGEVRSGNHVRDSRKVVRGGSCGSPAAGAQGSVVYCAGVGATRHGAPRSGW
jgi:ribosomal protein S18 acetylase RimI-like enzyme